MEIKSYEREVNGRKQLLTSLEPGELWCAEAQETNVRATARLKETTTVS